MTRLLIPGVVVLLLSSVLPLQAQVHKNFFGTGNASVHVPDPGPPMCAYCKVVNPTAWYHHRGDCPYYRSGKPPSGGGSSGSSSHGTSYVRPHTMSSENQAKLAMAQSLCDAFGAMFANMLADDSGARAAAAAKARAEEEARIKALIDRQVAEEAAARAAGKKEWAECLARHERERAQLQLEWAERLSKLAASLKVPDFDGRGAGLSVKVDGSGQGVLGLKVDGVVDPMALKMPAASGARTPSLGLKLDAAVDPAALKAHDPKAPSMAIKPPPPPPAVEPGEALPPGLQPLRDGYEYVQDKVAQGREAVGKVVATADSLIQQRAESDAEGLVDSAMGIPAGPGAEDRALGVGYIVRKIGGRTVKVLSGARDNVGNEGAALAVHDEQFGHIEGEHEEFRQDVRKSLVEKVKDAFKPAH